MMTSEELRDASINLEVAREVCIQATRRLEDLLSIAATFERRAFTLISAYLPTATALFGFSMASKSDWLRAGALFVAGALLVGGIWKFAMAVKDDRYGTLGSNPNLWIERGYIDGGEIALRHMLAHIARDYQNRIDVSRAANDRKARNISIGIYLGLASVIVLATWVFATIARSVAILVHA